MSAALADFSASRQARACSCLLCAVVRAVSGCASGSAISKALRLTFRPAKFPWASSPIRVLPLARTSDSAVISRSSSLKTPPLSATLLKRSISLASSGLRITASDKLALRPSPVTSSGPSANAMRRIWRQNPPLTRHRSRPGSSAATSADLSFNVTSSKRASTPFAKLIERVANDASRTLIRLVFLWA